MNKFKVGDKVQIKDENGIWEIVETNSGTSHKEYLCYQKGYDGHYGNIGSIKSENTGKGYDTKEYYFFNEEKFVNQLPEIRITTDGKTTTAQKILNGKVIKEASVTLYYKDTFDFDIGCEEVLKKLGTVPHLRWKCYEENIGKIGKLTHQTALFGEKLYVGDIVEVFNTYTRTLVSPCIVVSDTTDDYVMGFKDVKFHDGLADYTTLQLRKIKSYKDLKNGETIDDIEVVK